MSFYKTITPAAFAGMLAFAGCAKSPQANANSTAANAETSKPDTGYIGHTTKAGVPLSLSHNYDGHSDAGEVETIRITIRDGFDAGTLTAEVLETPGLNILTGNTLQSFRMEGNDVHSFDVQVSAPVDGQYGLYIRMIADAGVGNVARTTSTINLFVGNSALYEKSRSATDGVKKGGEPGMIVTEAEETIRPE